MLYELAVIARVSSPTQKLFEAQNIASTVGKLVINNKGVVREIVNLGVRPLPKIMKTATERHFEGSHFLMLFDSSEGVQKEIMRSLKNDPRVIRTNLLRKKDWDVSSYKEAVRAFMGQ
ncbi:mitochondrial 37S ribosomal protein YmS16 [Martiniozyma asiatica (nom. inval.)]|nr:mitochondrial 37S ribosomal protein YmS16 [Martiniozyma asiatica]